MNTPDWKHMAGTENTGEYRVIARNSAGDRIGVRPLDTGTARIRVEPGSSERASALAAALAPSEGWKQPGEDGQNRFSLVGSGDAGREAVLEAINALGQSGALERNTTHDVRTWRRLFVFEV